MRWKLNIASLSVFQLSTDMNCIVSMVHGNCNVALSVLEKSYDCRRRNRSERTPPITLSDDTSSYPEETARSERKPIFSGCTTPSSCDEIYEPIRMAR